LAIAALLELLDSINRPELEKLSLSNRAGLRQLACQAIGYFNSTRDIDQLLLLAKDSHSDVRLEAIQSIGKLKLNMPNDEIIMLARQRTKDVNYKVALSAAWLLILYAPDEGKKVMEQFLHDKSREVQLLAAAALGATGSYGMSLMLDQFRSHPDSLVRLNLALGLIGQRQATQEAAEYLRQMLMTENEKWNRIKVGIFEPIVNWPKKKGDETITTAETDNQLLRLELLNLLAILKTPPYTRGDSKIFK